MHFDKSEKPNEAEHAEISLVRFNPQSAIAQQITKSTMWVHYYQMIQSSLNKCVL